MNKLESGQVLPLGLVLVVMGMVGALIVYNTGVVATDKMRLANGADAAAYSGALWQARALNYQAYANRAMVANQVAIGQAVSIQSWMTYAAVTSENLATALRPVPVLNIVTGGIQSAANVAERVVSAGARTMLSLSNIATAALSASQDAMIVATVHNTAEMISVVASETDKRFTTNSAYGIANKVNNASQWWAFNTRYQKRDASAMQERLDIIMASRDKFTHARNWDLFSFWVPSSPRFSHKLRRQGQTRLVSVKTAQGLEWEWMAKDTLSIHTRKLRLFRSSAYYEFPVAWASAFTNSMDSRRSLTSRQCGVTGRYGLGSTLNQCSRFTTNNHDAESFADKNVISLAGRHTLKPMPGYGGVRSFWVLSDEARSAEDARLTVRVEVSLPLQQMNESNTVAGTDRLQAPVIVAGNTLSALSSADVYYRHPHHHIKDKSQREKANAYSPYWQTQLVPVKQEERTAALLLRSGGVSPTARITSANGSALDNYQGR